MNVVLPTTTIKFVKSALDLKPVPGHYWISGLHVSIQYNHLMKDSGLFEIMFLEFDNEAQKKDLEKKYGDLSVPIGYLIKEELEKILEYIKPK